MTKYLARFAIAQILANVFAAATLEKTTVDLGFAVYRPTIVEAPESRNVYYNFTNIRFAAPPLDSLRFTAPQPPLNNRSAGIQDGSYGNICPQAFPSWLITALTVNKVEYYNGIGAGQTESEDCLFLDVIVPEKVFQAGHDQGELKPVLIWLYGGGWVSGDKRSLTDPLGLLESAKQDMIFVAPNYRLGSFGFLAGASFISQGGTPNVGLLDQRAAFEWARKYIHLFGGDPRQVTLMGESAGAGSIFYHLTAPDSQINDAGSSTLFQRVIPQSPVILPHTQSDLEDTFDKYLKTLGVKTLDEAKNLSSQKLMKANQEVVGNAYYAEYKPGPAVSGEYVLDLPNRLISQYGAKITALVGHNSHEGKLFVNPKTQTDAAFNTYVSTKALSFLSANLKEYVINVLYPPAYDGSQPYTSVQERLALLIQEAFISCNAHILAQSTQLPAYGYTFNVPPGLHGQDIAYSFYTPGLPSPFVDNKTLAAEMQGYLTRFARTGDPNGGQDNVIVPEYHADDMVLDMNEHGFKVIKDEAANKRCAWWAQNI